jgi:hypothetical protein
LHRDYVSQVSSFWINRSFLISLVICKGDSRESRKQQCQFYEHLPSLEAWDAIDGSLWRERSLGDYQSPFLKRTHCLEIQNYSQTLFVFVLHGHFLVTQLKFFNQSH